MTPRKPARGQVRPNRAPLVIGSAVAMLCVGAGAASAQSAAPAETVAPAADTTPEAGAAETTAPAATTDAAGAEDAGSGEARSGEAGSEEAAADRARRRAPRLLLENVTPHQIYFAGKRSAEFNYKITGSGTTDLKIEVVKKGPGTVIQSWNKADVPADRKQRLRWDGSKRSGGHVRKGRFFFRAETDKGQPLRRKRATGQREFLIQPAIFPVRGRHQYWDGFGAGRGHQGQDVGAKCGTTMVAAEAGKVAYKAYDGGGYGYYLVINVRGQRRAEVYGHLKRKAAVRRGQRVKTGQKVGLVGATGNASGCHLHFEYWQGNWPGGHATPRVTKRLRAWDKWS